MQALKTLCSQRFLHAMPRLLDAKMLDAPCFLSKFGSTHLICLHHTADRCRPVSSLGDSVEQVSPDNVFSGVLLERNDSQLYREGNRPHLQQFCLGDLKAVAQQ